MPLYSYQCAACGAPDQRLAGLDDATAVCTTCGGLMLRLDADIFAPLFVEAERDTKTLRLQRGLAQARQPLEGKP